METPAHISVFAGVTGNGTFSVPPPAAEIPPGSLGSARGGACLGGCAGEEGVKQEELPILPVHQFP